MALYLLSSIQVGTLEITLPNHKQLRFQGKTNGPYAMVHFHNERCIKRFMTGGQLGFCESYLDEDWSSPDMSAFFELILRNRCAMEDSLLGKKWVRALSKVLHWFRPNTKKGSKKNIYDHYDIGNDFYKEWLDPTMTYSAALFKDKETDDLQTAQIYKYQELIDRLDLKPHHHLLEIGCGWGGFAEYAARTIGCKISCITISKAQFKYATDRIRAAGLDHLVDIQFRDYRDIHGRYDRIASIEMFEAVGEPYWPLFFETLKNKLKPGGKAALQIITIHDQDFHTYRRTPDYIQRYIFPGGMLPSQAALSKQIKQAGLQEGPSFSFGQDYAKTLALWNRNFQDAWPKIKGPSKTERFKRLWEQYLSYCEAGFKTGSIDVIQITVSHSEHLKKDLAS